MNPRERGFLLLTGYLGDPERKPLTVAQFRELAKRMQTMEKPVDSAPGKLDLSNTEEILSKYLIPQERLGEVEEGASLVHLMNSNLFTAAAFRLKNDADAETFAKALRENIQKNQWICGQPDRLVVAAPAGDTVLMVFGSEEAMELFGDSFTRAFPDAKVYFDEAITA